MHWTQKWRNDRQIFAAFATLCQEMPLETWAMSGYTASDNYSLLPVWIRAAPANLSRPRIRCVYFVGGYARISLTFHMLLLRLWWHMPATHQSVHPFLTHLCSYIDPLPHSLVMQLS